MNASLTTTPATVAPARFLRLALRVDGVATGLSGLLLLATGLGLADDLTGVPLGIQTGLGAFLVAYAVGVFALGSRRSPSRGLTWAVIALNAVYAVDCVIAVVAGLWPLTAVGVGMMIVQAVVVAAFAEAQFVGLRRLAR